MVLAVVLTVCWGWDQLDFDSYRSRLSTEAAKDPNSVATQKLEFKLEQAAMNLNNITSEISNRIVEIEQSRPTMLAAEFASIVACSHHQFSQMSLLLEKMLPLLPQSGATLCLLSYYSDKSKARSQAAAVRVIRVFSVYKSCAHITIVVGLVSSGPESRHHSAVCASPRDKANRRLDRG